MTLGYPRDCILLYSWSLRTYFTIHRFVLLLELLQLCVASETNNTRDGAFVCPWVWEGRWPNPWRHLVISLSPPCAPFGYMALCKAAASTAALKSGADVTAPCTHTEEADRHNYIIGRHGGMIELAYVCGHCVKLQTIKTAGLCPRPSNRSSGWITSPLRLKRPDQEACKECTLYKGCSYVMHARVAHAPLNVQYTPHSGPGVFLSV